MKLDLNKKLISLLAIGFLLTAFQSTTFAEPIISAPLASGSAQNALDFYNRFPKQPIPLTSLKNITPLTQNFWRPEDILKDLEKSGKKCAIVVVKTEICSGGSRLCAVTTAALEKQSAPSVSQCKVYMAWIKNNPDQRQKTAQGQQWEQSVASVYRFEQGPGAKISVLVTGVNANPRAVKEDPIFNGDALKLGLFDDRSHPWDGSAPKLEQFLQTALSRGRSNVIPASGTSGNPPAKPLSEKERRLLIKTILDRLLPPTIIEWEEVLLDQEALQKKYILPVAPLDKFTGGDNVVFGVDKKDSKLKIKEGKLCNIVDNGQGLKCYILDGMTLDDLKNKLSKMLKELSVPEQPKNNAVPKIINKPNDPLPSQIF